MMQSSHQVPAESDEVGEVSRLVEEAVRQWRTLVLGPILLAVAVVALFLILPKKYTSTVSFSPATQDLPAGGLAALAGQVGVNLGAEATASPDYLVSVLSTRELLEPIATGTYSVTIGGVRADTALADLLKTRSKDSAFTIAETVRALQESLFSVSIGRRSGLVTVEVSSRWPDLSHELANRLTQRLDTVLYNIRQQRAEAESGFLGSRLAVAREDLEQAEQDLADFLRRNRTFASDPVLSAKNDQLRRDLQLRAEVYSMLTQGFEQARTSAARNTPTISVVQPARAPLRYDRRHLLQKALGAYFVGIIIALLVFAATIASNDDASPLKSIATSVRESLRSMKRRSQGAAGSRSNADSGR